MRAVGTSRLSAAGLRAPLVKQYEASVALQRSCVGFLGQDGRVGDAAATGAAQVRPPATLFDDIHALNTELPCFS